MKSGSRDLQMWKLQNATTIATPLDSERKGTHSGQPAPGSVCLVEGIVLKNVCLSTGNSPLHQELKCTIPLEYGSLVMVPGGLPAEKVWLHLKALREQFTFRDISNSCPSTFRAVQPRRMSRAQPV